MAEEDDNFVSKFTDLSTLPVNGHGGPDSGSSRLTNGHDR